MILKQMEVQGFKSFPNKIELKFDQGITCVVGPNGSGKSNITDAIRWVLGEQSAKQLRGERMEDIIFGGTEKRKPLSFCEVSLTFDNQNNALPVPYSEVTVTRRVYRSGEGEYYINKNACRLKDIVELFRDTGIGKEGYSIIGQGRVEEILSNKGEDRRAVFEEAAGITKYKARKLEAERKLVKTRENMARLTDIVLELENQIGPLKEQSETAKRYLALQEELRTLEISQFVQQYQRQQARLADQLAQLQAIEEQEEQAARQDADLREALERASLESTRLEAALSRLQEDIAAQSAQARKAEGEANVLVERENHLRAEIARINQDVQSLQQQLENGESQAEQGGHSQAAHQAQIAQCTAELAAYEAESAKLGGQISDEEQRIEQAKNEIIRGMGHLSDVKNRITQLQTMRDAYARQLETTDGQKAQLEDQLLALLAEREQAEAQLAATRQEIEQAGQAFEQAQQQSARMAHEAMQAAARQQRLAADVQSAQQRLNLLKQMQRDFEGYQQSVRRLLEDCRRDERLSQKQHGVVAELLSVPAGLEKAVETALGGAMQHIVTPNEEDARDLIAHLRRRQYGRATFLPITAIQGRRLNEQERRTLGSGVVGIASELVSFDELYRPIMENLLGRTVIVEDMDSGIALSRQNRFAFRVVTREGDVINAGGAMTGGSAQARFTSLLGRERAVQDARAQLDRLKQDLTAAQQQSEQARAAQLAAEQAAQQAQQRRHQLDIACTREAERTGIVTDALAQKQAQLDELAQSRAALQENIQDAEQEIAGTRSATDQIEQGQKVGQQDVAAWQAALYQLRQAREKHLQQIADKRVQLAALEKEQSAALREGERMQRERQRLEQELARQGILLAQREQELAQAMAAYAQAVENTRAAQQQLEGLREQLTELTAQREAARQSADRASQQREALRAQGGERLEQKHKLTLAQNRIEQELETAAQRMWEQYELTYAGALPLAGELPTGGVSRIDALRKEIRAIGTVNVNAIEDYIKVGERYEYLTRQQADLQQADEQLQSVIAELQQKMQQRFSEQFVMIDGYFRQTFTALFGGGTAELQLSDENNVLECDINIVAQPPGKKLQLLSLLSGGEKALTAIALLFAMLNLKPTPFCVLDEIDAPLDESNIGRFASYLRDYADKTQFIVVTHHKGTMEVGDALYGVSMEEKGISRLISMRMEDKPDTTMAG